MAKYVLKFSKEGYFKYTSHLDLLRFFKRSFKRIDVKLDYSQGFNPHPKMAFAQPLSLGYSSICELLEFETLQDIDVQTLKNKLSEIMPEGLKILDCILYKGEGKTLAALTEAAEYIICIPFDETMAKGRADVELCEEFLSQEHIFVKKKQKKTKALVDIDIKTKIRHLILTRANDTLLLSAMLDAGSESNLSPELLIEAFLRFLNGDIERHQVEVLRKKIVFSNNFYI